MEWTFEAFVSIDLEQEELEQAAEEIGRHSISWRQVDGEFILAFESSTVKIRRNGSGVSLRVEASELAICDGTKALVIAALNDVARDMPHEVLWVRANDEPFSAIASHIS